MPLRALILSLVLAGLAAAPASAADVVLRTFDETDVGSIDAYGDRVAWTETGDSESGALMTLEGSEAVAVDVKPVRHLDLAAGPDGKPVAVYDRCKAGRCTYFLYDFAAQRERALKGAPAGRVDNWAFWRDRFAFVRDGRLHVAELGGRPRDVGHAKSLAGKPIDFNGAGVSYVNNVQPEEDVEEYRLAYWPAPAKGRFLMRAAHGASGDLSLGGPVLSATRAYVTQFGGEFGGPWRLWRVDLRSGERRHASVPAHTEAAVPVGAKRVVAATCPPSDDWCRLVLRSVTYRAA